MISGNGNVNMIGHAPSDPKDSMITPRISGSAIVVAVNHAELFSVEPVLNGPSCQSLSPRTDETRGQGGGFAATYRFDGGIMEISLLPDDKGAIRLESSIRPQGGLRLSRFGLLFHYLPSVPSAWKSCAESFHWLPNIKSQENCVAGDHVFRSPAAILTMPCHEGLAVAPDLDQLAACRPVPQYLDLGFPESRPPWIELGFTPQKTTGHVSKAVTAVLSQDTLVVTLHETMGGKRLPGELFDSSRSAKPSG